MIDRPFEKNYITKIYDNVIQYININVFSFRKIYIMQNFIMYFNISCRLLHFMVVDKGETQFHDSGLLMILMARCTFMAFGVYDHMRVKKGHDEEVELTALQLQNELDARPGFMDFFSYVYFSPFLFFGKRELKCFSFWFYWLKGSSSKQNTAWIGVGRAFLFERFE